MMKTKIRCSLLLLSMTLITFFSLSGVKSLDKLFEDDVLSLAETLPCEFAPANCQAGGCYTRKCSIRIGDQQGVVIEADHDAYQEVEAPEGEFACCWREKVEQDGIPTFYRPRALTFSASCCN